MSWHKNPDRSDSEHFHLFEEYVRAFGLDRSKPNADPYRDKQKTRSWWPMRYYMDDWILAVWVYRIKHRERCEVGLFLAEDHTKYVKNSGIKGGLICLLTQTFHLLGKMEICFVGPQPNERPTIHTGFQAEIPKSIRRFASDLGIGFKHSCIISDAEGRKLYARMTGFSQATIEDFSEQKIDLTRACFVVQRDIWSLDQVEYLLQHAPQPERLFDRGVSSTDRLSVLLDQVVLRAAILEERLRIVVEKFSPEGKSNQVKAEWVEANRIRYTCDQSVSLPLFGGDTRSIPAGTPFEVVVLPRNAKGYTMFAADDARQAMNQGVARFLGVTRDIEWTGLAAQNIAVAAYLRIFDTLSELDSEVDLRLSQALTTRSELSERQE